MILKVWSALEEQLEGKLEVILRFRGPSCAQEAPSCAWSAAWRRQVALGVWLGGAKLRLECGLEAQEASKSSKLSPRVPKLAPKRLQVALQERLDS